MNELPSSTTQPVFISHVRVARPTDRLAELTAFYRDVLDLEVLTSFDHEGFAGVILGRRGTGVHLEFTHEHGTRVDRTLSAEDLLVFYYEPDAWETIRARIEALKIPTVRSHNPYWERHGITIEDPDRARVVLHRGRWPLA